MNVDFTHITGNGVLEGCAGSAILLMIGWFFRGLRAVAKTQQEELVPSKEKWERNKIRAKVLTRLIFSFIGMALLSLFIAAMIHDMATAIWHHLAGWAAISLFFFAWYASLVPMPSLYLPTDSPERIRWEAFWNKMIWAYNRLVVMIFLGLLVFVAYNGPFPQDREPPSHSTSTLVNLPHAGK